MSKRFENKVCIVTASSSGIGFAISERFAREGGIVIINSRSEKNVNDAVKKIQSFGGKAEGVVCHVAKAEDRKRLVETIAKKYGGIDVLVPNAAVSTHFGTFMDTSEAAMDKMWEVNVKGVFLLCKEALP